MKVSNCCGEKGGGVHAKFYPWSELSFEERDLCPKCGEHCEYIEETDLNTINTENEQRNSKTGLSTGTSGTDKKNLSEGCNG